MEINGVCIGPLNFSFRYCRSDTVNLAVPESGQFYLLQTVTSVQQVRLKRQLAGVRQIVTRDNMSHATICHIEFCFLSRKILTRARFEAGILKRNDAGEILILHTSAITNAGLYLQHNGDPCHEIRILRCAGRLLKSVIETIATRQRRTRKQVLCDVK